MRLVLTVNVPGEVPGEVMALDIIKTRHLTASQRAKRRGKWKDNMNLGKTRASMPAFAREVKT